MSWPKAGRIPIRTIRPKKTPADMEKILSSRWFHLMITAFIAVSIILVYSNTFNSGFQFDDTTQILDNQLIKNLDIMRLLRGLRGITMASFALNYAISGTDVVSYHIVNTLIHVINSAMAYFFIFKTLRLLEYNDLWSKKVSAFSALLFALHPVQTQAVTYIVQRMESLSGMFYLATLLLFIKAVRAGSFAGRLSLYACVCISYALGFYSKESAITIPAVLFLYDLFFVNNGRIKGVFSRWPLYAIMAVLLVFFAVSTLSPLKGQSPDSGVTAFEAPTAATPGSAVTDRPSDPIYLRRGPTAGFAISGLGPREYLFTQFNVIVYYMALLAVPVNQNLDYDFPVSRGLFKRPAVYKGTVLNIPIPPPFVSFLILAAVITLAAYLYFKSIGETRPTRRVITFFIFWFFIILSPTSSFIPIIDVIFEHRVYLASLGFFVIFVISVEFLSAFLMGKKRAGPGDDFFKKLID